jgi:hypothetical protein
MSDSPDPDATGPYQPPPPAPPSGLRRRLWGLLRSGDILVGDRLMCAWTEMG